MSLNRSKSSSSGTSAGTYREYFNTMNQETRGRLKDFARNGTEKLTPEQIQAMGGLGATRRRDVEDARGRAIEELTADPNLTVDQRVRSRQLMDEDAQSRLDAIAKETEAAITDLMRYNNELTRADLESLAAIFYGGKAQQSQSSQTGGSFWG